MPVCARRKLLLVAFLAIAANVLDLASTYAVSPDLALEWNVLQRHFGLGWAGLICAKVLGVWLAIVGYACYQNHRAECYPPPGADWRAFCRGLSFGAPGASARDRLASLQGRRLSVNMGYFWAGMQALVFWVALDNVLLGRGIVFPLRAYSEMGYHMLQSAVVASAVMFRFYAGNYRRYGLLSPGFERCAPGAI